MERIVCENVEIYRSVLDSVKTNMYVLPCGRDVVVVDPHPDSQAAAYIAERKPQTVWIFLTHEHPDHTLGVPWLRERFPCRLVCQRRCAERVAVAANNRPLVIVLSLAAYDMAHGTHRREEFEREHRSYVCQADVTFENSHELTVGKDCFAFQAAPGHSPGGCLIKLNDRVVFTGDNLIPETEVIFRFKGGDQSVYETVTRPLISKLTLDTMVLPGHGEPSRRADYDI